MQRSLKSIFGDHHGLDEKSVDFLTRALEKNNLPGFDYLEFKQSLRTLVDKMNLEEGTAMQSAFATASTVGLTKEKLLKTAQHYIAVLNKEKEQFDTAMKKQLVQRVESKTSEVEKLRKQIEEYKEKIKTLQAHIEKSQSTIDHADENIQAERDKIEQTRDNFEHTLQSILNEIEKDVDNIEKYL